MAIENVPINPGTATPIAADLVGTTYYQVMKLDIGTDGATSGPWDGKVQGGTINAGTTVITGGSVVLTVGTISSMPNVTLAGGTVQNLNGGTLGLVTSVTEVANLAKGTITKLEGGTVGLITRVGNLGTLELGTTVMSSGTLNVGTVVNNGGTVAEITNGTIRVTAGTVSNNMTSGTLNLGTVVMTSGTLNVGTVVNNGGTIAEITNGTIRMSVGTVAAGSIVVTAGTVVAGTLTNLGTAVGMGTLTNVGQVYNAGTLQAGTISNILGGTVKLDGRVGRNVLTYGTVFGGTAAGYATLVGSAAVGVGTSTWVTAFKLMNVGAGTLDMALGFGTALNGTSILDRGSYAVSSGFGGPLSLPVNAGMTNQDLVCWIGAAGTIQVTVKYFISA